MNAVEIEEAVSDLAQTTFDRAEFPYEFLKAFGNKDVTIKKLRSGQSNASDIPGGILQRNNIHICVCDEGLVGETLQALKASPKTTTAKAKFILATDGITLEAEDMNSGETIAAEYPKFADHFGFFLPLAGISTVKEIKNNPIDVKATGRLNKLYVELLKDNPEWGTDEKRPALNQFMAQLIFCFFAEDTGIFRERQFTKTIDQMSDSQSGNTHEVLAELFRAMDTKPQDRAKANLRSWADAFPYVNGGLFTGTMECPRFSRIARSYLLRAGELDWQLINPDIFGSMIQAVADDDERGELGMHYTSVPNILKVLNPLFLDDLREQLEAAGDNVRKLRNLRKRLSTIRVFDPACGSGNFLVIAYLQMREIEHQIIKRTGDQPRSKISLSNFYGIEIKGFAAEIARLALLIAEFQSDVRFINQHEARAMVLPLHRTGQIHVGNALRANWLEVCPPPDRELVVNSDLGGPTGEISVAEEGDDRTAESITYICGNPPYLGGKGQSKDQKADLDHVFPVGSNHGELDYVSAWFFLAAKYAGVVKSSFAFVSTNSINQGSQVHQLWPLLYEMNLTIDFAYEPFKWSNSATSNAAVLCTIIGMSISSPRPKRLYTSDMVRNVKSIGPYLTADQNVIVTQSLKPISKLPQIVTGNSPYDGGSLIVSPSERHELVRKYSGVDSIIRRMYGSADYINGQPRYCLWITDTKLDFANSFSDIRDRIDMVRKSRQTGGDVARGLVRAPHRFRYTHTANYLAIIIPRVSSERREYLPVGLLDNSSIISDSAQAIYDPEIWIFAIVASKIHMAWAKTVAGKLKSDIRYSSALCYNTFPVPDLTDQHKIDLSNSAKDILLTRESHFPATIADLYDPDNMPDDLRRAHDYNDELVERIYIGRRFRNDTERLEKLFELYTKMNTAQPQTKKKAKSAA